MTPCVFQNNDSISWNYDIVPIFTIWILNYPIVWQLDARLRYNNKNASQEYALVSQSN